MSNISPPTPFQSPRPQRPDLPPLPDLGHSLAMRSVRNQREKYRAAIDALRAEIQRVETAAAKAFDQQDRRAASRDRLADLGMSNSARNRKNRRKRGL